MDGPCGVRGELGQQSCILKAALLAHAATVHFPTQNLVHS